MKKNWAYKNDKHQPPRETYYQSKKYSWQKKITYKFDNIFVRIGLKLAEKKKPKYFLKIYIYFKNTKLPEQTVSINELKKKFF